MSAEPSVAVGDSGEQVSFLQERLQRLGYYHGSLDGSYGPHTEEAVRQLQELAGLERDGHVQVATWDAIEHQESLHGGSDQHGTEPSTGEGRQLSEDGQWWWDGVDWQPVGEQPAAEHASVDGGHAEFQLSPDGQFQWDGSQWLPTAGGESLLNSPDPLHAGDLHFDDVLVAQFAGPVAAPAGPATPSTDQELTGFATKSAELTTEHRAILARVAADLNAHPLTAGGFVTLTGFADRRGKQGMNKELGQRRADAVRDYLVQLVTDESTRNNIRTQSMGEPNDGPEVDDPSLRKVEIEITRPAVTPPPTTNPPPPVIDLDPTRGRVKDILDEQVNGPGGPPKPPVQPGVNLPPDFWKEIPKAKPKPGFVKQLSDWANEKLGTKEVAKIAGELADGLGMDRARVERMVNDAFKRGGEAGVKALLNEIVEGIAGPASSR